MEKALQFLNKYYGYRAFTEGQGRVISTLLQKRDVLGIMPGTILKSICYQIPAMRFSGVTFAITPSPALMKNQVRYVNDVGLYAAYVNELLTENQIGMAYEGIRKGDYPLVYVAPEYFLREDFLELLKEVEVSMVVIDEAEHLSEHSDSFREDYAKVISVVETLSADVGSVVSAFTSVLSEEVKEDILRHLNQPEVVEEGFARKLLYFPEEIKEGEYPGQTDAEFRAIFEEIIESKLRGSINEMVERLADILVSYSRQEVMGCLVWLQMHQYLSVVHALYNYDSVWIGKRFDEVFDVKTVPTVLDEKGIQLFVRIWRQIMFQTKSKYFDISKNAVMRACMRCPRTKEELLLLDGFGTKLVEKYGGMILRELQPYFNETDGALYFGTLEKTAGERKKERKKEILETFQFSLTREQAERFSYTKELSRTEMKEKLLNVLDMEYLPEEWKYYVSVMDSHLFRWLREEGLCEKVLDEATGKMKDIVTEKGKERGIFYGTAKSKSDGKEYKTTFFDENAQRMIVEHFTEEIHSYPF